MSALTPLETVYDVASGESLPLPPELRAAYGPLVLPRPKDRSYVLGNAVSTLDGVVALGGTGPSGGPEISGANPQDKMLIGLLRAAADAVVVGAGTLRSVPRHRWTAERAFPPLGAAFQALRVAMGQADPPLIVIVSARGALDLSLPVFQGGSRWLIVTTRIGAQRLAPHAPAGTLVAVGEGASDDEISASAILAAIEAEIGVGRVLVEGGPRLFASFLAERRLDTLFLTISPQIAGRDATVERPGLVAGHLLAPENPLWSTLVGIKRGGSHLFLRYALG